MDNTTIDLFINVLNDSPFTLEKVSTALLPSQLFKLIFEEGVKRNIFQEKDKSFLKKLKYTVESNGKIEEKCLNKEDYVENKIDTIGKLGLTGDNTITINLNQTIIQEFGGMELNNLAEAQTQEIKFSNKFAKWRYLKEGLNIEGTCENNDCEAYNQRVINVLRTENSPYGFGEIDMVKYLIDEKFVCPMCKNWMFPPSNYYFRHCKFEWIAQVKEDKMKTYKNEGVARKDQDCVTFKETAAYNKKMWAKSYKFIVSKLDC